MRAARYLVQSAAVNRAGPTSGISWSASAPSVMKARRSIICAADKYSFACPELTAKLCSVLEQKGVPYRKGTSWTTDAPYRETVEEFQRHCSDGVATVEMEASALFAVGAFRGVSVCSVFTISDILSADGWLQGYHSEEKLEGLKKIFEVALETIAIDST